MFGSPFLIERRMKMDINKIKKIAVIFLGCTAGSVLIQLAAPMILVAIISAASFCNSIPALPSGSGKGWRIRLVTAKQDKQREDTAADEYKVRQGVEMRQRTSLPHQKKELITYQPNGKMPWLFGTAAKGKTS